MGSVSMLGSGMSSAQNGGMMNGGHMWSDDWMGGYGGLWGPILLAVVVGVIVWAITKNRK
jgi:hypothetical protein